MLNFNSFNRTLIALHEGGNIKVKTASGETVSAEPFKVKDRGRQTKDIHDALKSIHDSYHAETKHHLFGKNASGLTSGSVYAGTTKHFMNAHIPDHEFKKHKPTVGDIDAQIPMEHKDHLATFLKPGDRHGRYTVVGTKKHGTETSVVMRHDNGEHHQFDLEGTHHYQATGPHKDEQFLHSANWDDAKSGISGAHHKILINSAGLDKHKFSITHGLRSRTDETDHGSKSPKEIAHKLFSKGADENDMHSFKGVTQLIKRHIHPSKHQAIYDKFKSGLVAIRGKDHKAALDHLRQHLNAKDDIKESVNEKTHHTSVVPMVGFSPISHMGHAKDLGGALSKLPGTKHIGISSKADLFSPEERRDILKKQWGDKADTSSHVVKGAGETIRKAHDSLPKHGRKVLHLLVGSDRTELAAGLKKSLEQGKLKEMEGHHFDEIHIHTPEDSDRSHGMSGTKMRQAASDGNEEEFHKHVGKMFSKIESNHIMNRVKTGIQSGALKIKRPSDNKKKLKEETQIINEVKLRTDISKKAVGFANKKFIGKPIGKIQNRFNETSNRKLSHHSTMPDGRKVYHGIDHDDHHHFMTVDNGGNVDSSITAIKKGKAHDIDMAVAKPGAGVHKLYHHLITKHNAILTTSEQSLGGFSVWKKMRKMGGVNVHGYHPKTGKGEKVDILKHPEESHVTDTELSKTLRTAGGSRSERKKEYQHTKKTQNMMLVAHKNKNIRPIKEMVSEIIQERRQYL